MPSREAGLQVTDIEAGVMRSFIYAYVSSLNGFCQVNVITACSGECFIETSNSTRIEKVNSI